MRRSRSSKVERKISGGSNNEVLKAFIALFLVAIVALAPLHLGANRPDSWTLIALATAFLLVLMTLVKFDGWRAPGAQMPGDLKISLLLVLLVAVWILVQASTWTPESWHHPIWSQTSIVLGQPLQGRISLAPEFSLQAAMRLLTYLGLFVAVLLLSRKNQRARLGFLLLVVICGVYALFGLYRYALGIETILWFEDQPQNAVLTSTFINRNSFADYAAMGLLISNGLLLNALARRNASQPSFLASIAGNDRRGMILVGLVACMAFVLMVALVLTAARGAFVVFAITAMLQILCFMFWGGLSPRLAIPVAALFCAGLVAVVLIWGQSLQERLVHAWEAPTYEKSDFDRIRLMAIGADAAMDRPILGNGMGSFRYVFSMARDERLASEKWFSKQHNTYLENVIELGFVAAFALFSVFLMAVIRFIGGMRKRRSGQVFSNVGLMVCFYVGVHSSFDITLQVPANTILFVVILGICLAQVLAPPRSPAR